MHWPLYESLAVKLLICMHPSFIRIMIRGNLEKKQRQESRMENQLKEQKRKKSRASAAGVETEDYVRVKARRGEATDNHSLAERARRAKIRMRMKLLQSLVPGCDKITGKAQVLDEIIKYVQFLQKQVESLAAKIAFMDLKQFECEQKNPSRNACIPEGMLPSVLESSSISFMSFADSAPSDYVALLHTHDQKATLIPQDGRDLLLDMEDQPEAIRQLVHLLSSANYKEANQ